jgi:dolichyl-phosphate beta-glucosyltransferase
VIPAFREEGRVGSTVRAVQRFLDGRRYAGEIIVVDDGSPDGTLREARALAPACPDLRVLTFRDNHGKGFAVRQGMLAATQEAVLFTDADLSTPIEDVDRLWPSLDAGCPVVFASRHLPGSRGLVRQSWKRRTMGRVFNAILSLLGVRGIRDTQCGFKLFRRETAWRLFEPMRTLGFAFDVEILLRAQRLGIRIGEVPVRWTEGVRSHVRPVRDAARMVRDILRMRRWIR